MALMTVEGVYRDGEIQLAERPSGINEVPVLVVFLPASDTAVPAKENGTAAGREAARRRAFARMRAGIRLGGPPYPSREELHDRGRR